MTLSLKAGRRYRVTAAIPVLFGTGSALAFLGEHGRDVRVLRNTPEGSRIRLEVEVTSTENTGRIAVPFVTECREVAC
jgi:hypothetical protein